MGQHLATTAEEVVQEVRIFPPLRDIFGYLLTPTEDAFADVVTNRFSQLNLLPLKVA